MDIMLEFTTNLARFSADMGRTADAVEASYKKIDGSINDSLKQIANQSKKTTDTLEKNFDKAFKDVENKAKKLGKGFNDAINVAFGAAAIGGVAGVGKAALAAADEFNVLQQRIKTATKATGDYKAVSDALYNLSVKTGTNFKATVDVYQGLARQAKELGASNADIVKLTGTMQKLGVIGGSSAESMKAGLTQFAQAMAGGTVRAEEFNSIVENMPEVAARMAKGFGVSQGQLRQMMLDSKLTAKDVFNVLLKQSAEVDAEFGKMPKTLERSKNAFGLAFGSAASELDKTTHATQTLAGALDAIATMLPKLVGLFQNLQKATGFMTNRVTLSDDPGSQLPGGFNPFKMLGMGRYSKPLPAASAMVGRPVYPTREEWIKQNKIDTASWTESKEGDPLSGVSTKTQGAAASTADAVDKKYAKILEKAKSITGHLQGQVDALKLKLGKQSELIPKVEAEAKLAKLGDLSAKDRLKYATEINKLAAEYAALKKQEVVAKETEKANDALDAYRQKNLALKEQIESQKKIGDNLRTEKKLGDLANLPLADRKRFLAQLKVLEEERAKLEHEKAVGDEREKLQDVLDNLKKQNEEMTAKNKHQEELKPIIEAEAKIRDLVKVGLGENLDLQKQITDEAKKQSELIKEHKHEEALKALKSMTEQYDKQNSALLAKLQGQEDYLPLLLEEQKIREDMNLSDSEKASGIQGLRDRFQQTQRLTQALEDQKRTVEDIKGANASYKEKLAALDAALQQGRVNHKQYTDSVRDLYREQLKTETSADKFAKTLTNGLSQAITSGKSFKQVLVDMGKQLAVLAAQELLLKPLTNGIANLGNRLFGTGKYTPNPFGGGAGMSNGGMLAGGMGGASGLMSSSGMGGLGAAGMLGAGGLAAGLGGLSLGGGGGGGFSGGGSGGGGSSGGGGGGSVNGVSIASMAQAYDRLYRTNKDVYGNPLQDFDYYTSMNDGPELLGLGKNFNPRLAGGVTPAMTAFGQSGLADLFGFGTGGGGMGGLGLGSLGMLGGLGGLGLLGSLGGMFGGGSRMGGGLSGMFGGMFGGLGSLFGGLGSGFNNLFGGMFNGINLGQYNAMKQNYNKLQWGFDVNGGHLMPFDYYTKLGSQGAALLGVNQQNSGGFMNALGGLGRLFGFQGFATGGNASSSKPFLAGEQGTELIVPSSDMHIFNATDTSRIQSAVMQAMGGSMLNAGAMLSGSPGSSDDMNVTDVLTQDQIGKLKQYYELGQTGMQNNGAYQQNNLDRQEWVRNNIDKPYMQYDQEIRSVITQAIRTGNANQLRNATSAELNHWGAIQAGQIAAGNFGPMGSPMNARTTTLPDGDMWEEILKGYRKDGIFVSDSLMSFARFHDGWSRIQLGNRPDQPLTAAQGASMSMGFGMRSTTSFGDGTGGAASAVVGATDAANAWGTYYDQGGGYERDWGGAEGWNKNLRNQEAIDRLKSGKGSGNYVGPSQSYLDNIKTWSKQPNNLWYDKDGNLYRLDNLDPSFSNKQGDTYTNIGAPDGKYYNWNWGREQTAKTASGAAATAVGAGMATSSPNVKNTGIPVQNTIPYGQNPYGLPPFLSPVGDTGAYPLPDVMRGENNINKPTFDPVTRTWSDDMKDAAYYQKFYDAGYGGKVKLGNMNGWNDNVASNPRLKSGRTGTWDMDGPAMFSGSLPSKKFGWGGRPGDDAPVVVGDRGPELFWPDKLGSIVPSDKSKQLMSSGDVIINFENKTGVPMAQPQVERGLDGSIGVILNAVQAAGVGGGTSKKVTKR